LDSKQAIKWIYNFEEAKESASKTHKPILIQFERDRCSGCKKLEALTYKDENVVEELLNWFIPLKLDILSNRKIRSKYSAIWTPSFYVIDYREKPYWFFEGYLNIEDFRIILRTAIVRYYLPHGKYKEAIEILKDSIDRFTDNPRTASLMLLLGQAQYLRNWDNKLFRASTKDVLDKFPDSAEARMWPWMV